MRLRLRGINTVRYRAADGELRTHYYHKLSGARIEGRPGTPEFLDSIAKAERDYRSVPDDVFKSITVAYRKMPEFTDLAPKTRKDYERILKMIETEFGDVPLAVMGDLRIRGDFSDWRDKIAKRSAWLADYAWSVLRRVIKIAYDRGKLAYNHAKEPGRLYSSDRSDKIWSANQFSAFMEKASIEMQEAMIAKRLREQRI
jgi:hypothetical protein